MGGDRPPEQLFAVLANTTHEISESDTLVLYGTEKVLQAFDASEEVQKASRQRLEFVACPEVIEMEDAPLTAVRRKKDSSMVTGICALRDQNLHAFVSAGNTGALVASGAIYLPMLPGVERPALLALLPTRKGFVAVVDVGGNISPKPEHLLQFARMGAAYLRSYGISRTPTVGLLNIGEEAKKGTPEAQEAYELIAAACQEQTEKGEALAMEFLGNIEGREVFQGKVDVLVTDGFTGNVFLKTSEGVSHFILTYLQDAFAEESDPRLDNVIRQLRGIVDYDQYPGAVISGVDRILIKCHGASSPRAMFKGMLGARDLLRRNWLAAMKQQLTALIS